jgi:lysophospholipase L1-like esterase
LRKNFVTLVLLIVVSFVAILVAVDCIAVPYLEDKQLVVSKAWKEDTFKRCMMSNERLTSPPGLGVFRSKNIEFPEKKTKLKRLLVVGDSYVIGFGLSNINNVWWRQLQRELIRRGYNDVEVVGLHSFTLGNTASQLDQVERWASKYHADAIIWGYQPSDAEELQGPRYFIERLSPKKESAAAKVVKRTMRSLIPNISQVLLSLEDRHYAANAIGSPAIGYEDSKRDLLLYEGENFRHFNGTLERMHKFADRTKIPLFIVTLPTQTAELPEAHIGKKSQQLFNEIEAYYKTRFALASKAYQSNGLKFFDLTDAYLNAIRKDPQFAGETAAIRLATTPPDPHPCSFTTHLYAVEVADILEKNYPQCIGPTSQVKEPELKINDCMPPSLGAFKIAPRSYILAFPTNDHFQLSMPIRKPYVQLNFEMPGQIKTIKLTGPWLRKATIWLTAVDPKDGYDRELLHQLPEKKGSQLAWDLPKEPWTSQINTLRISAEIKGADNRLNITF